MIHIITGLPGSGKTTVTRILGAKSNAIIINTDELHQLLYPEGAHTSTGDFTDESLKVVYKCLRPLAYYLSFLSPNRDVVFEGSFRFESQRKFITEILEINKIKHHVLFVSAGTDREVKERLNERLKTGHAGDFQHYLDMKDTYEKPTNAYELVNNGTLAQLEEKINNYLETINK